MKKTIIWALLIASLAAARIPSANQDGSAVPAPPMPEDVACNTPLTACIVADLNDHVDFLPVGDLDRDGLSDVLLVTYEQPDRRWLFVAGERVPLDPEGSVRLTAVKGTTGERLWDWTLSDRNAVLISTPLGVAGHIGILVVEHQDLGEVGPTLTALSGDGSVHWRRGVESMLMPDVSDAESVGLAPRVSVVGDIAPGPSSDVAVAFVDATDFAGTSDGFAAVLAIDGSDGRDAWRALVPVPEGQESHVAPGDLDGDGAGDLAVAISGTGSSENGITALSGVDGSVLWTFRTPIVSAPCCSTLGFGVVSAGDSTGAGHVDLMTWTGYSHGSNEPNARMVDGATGALRWERAAGFLEVIGDIDRDGLPDVAASRFVPGGARYDAFRGNGATLYRIEMPGVYPEYETAGDVDGDGVSDFNVWRAPRREVRSGRSMTLIVAGPVGVPLRETVDGIGDDYAVTFVGGDRATIKVLDGQTSLPLWEVNVPVVPAGEGLGACVCRPAARDLTGDGRAEVLAVLVSNVESHFYGALSYESIVALSGVDGRVVWRHNAYGG